MFTSQEMSEEDLKGPSSLAIVVGESKGAPLAIFPFQAHPPSPYDDLDWENDNLLFDEDYKNTSSLSID